MMMLTPLSVIRVARVKGANLAKRHLGKLLGVAGEILKQR
jgi:hypothetical protein